MSTFGSSGGSQSVSLSGATTPVVTLVDMPTGGTEYFLLLPSGCKQFLIKSSSGIKFQVGYLTTGPYLNVPKYCFYGESALTTDAVTLYFTSLEDNETAEIVTWV